MDLRPKFNRADTYAKACEQVENMEKEFLTLISKNKFYINNNILFYFL
jgi:hypothetical protein